MAPAPEPNPDQPDQPNSADMPYVHGRDLVPLRFNGKPTARHQRLFAHEDAMRAQIRQLDQQLLDLAAQRQALLAELRELHHELRPTYTPSRGRRRRPVSPEPPLPPIARPATLVTGRALRALCLAFLRQAARPLTLRALHAQLHRAGYAIDHPHPAKTLADALGHETDHQRCSRIRRGTYSLHPNPPYPHTAHDEPAIPDW